LHIRFIVADKQRSRVKALPLRDSKGKFVKKPETTSTSEDEVDQAIIPELPDLDNSELSALSSVPSHIVSAASSSPASPFASEAEIPGLTASNHAEQSHFYGNPNVTTDNIGDVANVLEEELRRRERAETITTDRTSTSTQVPNIRMAGVNPNITRPLFGGDENPKQFWNDVEEYLEGCEEVTKCKRVERLWRVESAAEAWYEDLDVSTKHNWEALGKAFQEKWNKKSKHTLSEATLLDILQQDAPSDRDLLDFVTQNGRPVPKLVSWWRTTNNLVLAHRMNDSLAERFRGNLKATALRDMLPVVETWKELDLAIQAVSPIKLKERVALFAPTTHEPAKEKETAATLTAGDNAMRTSLSIDDLIRAAQALNLGRTSPVSHIQPTSYYAQAATPRWNGPPVNAVRARAPATTRLPPEERMALIRQTALAPQPNTEEGRATYEKQKRDWHVAHGGDRPNEYRPYPLTPGTLVIASGECWKCGLRRHRQGIDCPGPFLPEPENSWRVTAGIAESEARRAQNAAAVQLVGAGGYGGDAYGQPHQAAMSQIFYKGQWVPLVQGDRGAMDLAWEQGKD
ncbi:hypothetical protein TRAPUB_8660, partial [Trametes pubescens]